MKKPKGYNETQEYGGGYKSLPAGGYVVRILKAEETQSKAGNPMLKLAVDIAQGEYEGFFTDMYKRRKAKDAFNAKWPNDGIMYVLTVDKDGNCHRQLKSFCGAMEKTGYQVWTEQDELMTATFKDKLIGLTFGREEWQNQSTGKTGWSTKGKFFCTLDDIAEGNFRVPEDVPLKLDEFASGIPGFADLEESEDSSIPF